MTKHNIFCSIGLIAILLAPSGAASTACNTGPWVVQFDQNVSIITRETRQLIDQFIDTAGNCGYAMALVAGHSDKTERIEIADERTDNIVRYLGAHGIPPRYITALTLGMTVPRIENDSHEPEPQNRRVELSWGELIVEPNAQ